MHTIDSVLSRYGVPKIESNFPEGDLTYSLLHLWLTFWGKAAPTSMIWDLKLKRQLKYTKGMLVVLEQYPLVLDRLMAHRQSTSIDTFGGILITGSPGIGKTSCLWYLLVMHLCKAEPVVLLYDNEFHVFTDSGFYALTENTAVALKKDPFLDVLCLTDMDAKRSTLWPLVLARSAACFTVAVSSPQHDKYHEWVKQCEIATIVLDAPSFTDFRKFIDGPVDKKKFENYLRHVLNIYGPNMRVVIRFIRNFSPAWLQARIEQHVIAIKDYLEGLNKDELKCLFTRPDFLKSSFSHTLVHTYGTPAVEDGDEIICHRIRTPLVLRLLLQSYQELRLKQLRDMYELFSISSSLAISRGWAFEILCHAKICEMDELILHPLFEQNKMLKTDGVLPVHVFIGKRWMEIYTAGREVGSTANKECYYVPAEGNNPTFNALIPGEASLALQMSIAQTHTFKHTGVPMFRKRLMAFDKGHNWKMNRMKFAFVIPTGHASGFQVPASRLRDVDFFVLELDVGNGYERFYEDENCDDDPDIDMDDNEMTA